MSHTPYGYRIENGKAVVDPAASEKLIMLFNSYLGGATLSVAAATAGIESSHSSIGKLLQNKYYLGDDYYPPIIDTDIFDAAQSERQKRAKKLGRIREPKELEKVVFPTVFRMSESTQQFDDPFEQAEYAYNLIEIEVKSDGRE